ncbi:MAG TPA: prepilin peptidase, partial [Candidatus Acidoferrales bacterium]|nr:prepilin peptidase [Candidatus Acidoferrales bacterium]
MWHSRSVLSPIVIGACVFFLGLLIGSFLNVCILRIPEGKSIVLPASACPKCGAKIRPYDNIP